MSSVLPYNNNNTNNTPPVNSYTSEQIFSISWLKPRLDAIRRDPSILKSAERAESLLQLMPCMANFEYEFQRSCCLWSIDIVLVDMLPAFQELRKGYETSNHSDKSEQGSVDHLTLGWIREFAAPPSGKRTAGSNNSSTGHAAYRDFWSRGAVVFQAEDAKRISRLLGPIQVVAHL